MGVEYFFFIAFCGIFLLTAYHDSEHDSSLASGHGVYIWELIALTALGLLTSPAGFLVGTLLGALVASTKVVHKADIFIFGAMGAGVGALTGSVMMIIVAGIITVLLMSRALKKTGHLPPVTPYALASAFIVGIVGVII